MPNDRCDDERGEHVHVHVHFDPLLIAPLCRIADAVTRLADLAEAQAADPADAKALAKRLDRSSNKLKDAVANNPVPTD